MDRFGNGAAEKTKETRLANRTKRGPPVIGSAFGTGHHRDRATGQGHDGIIVAECHMAKKPKIPKPAWYTAGSGNKPPKGVRMSNRRTCSDFLFARPSFVSGVARLMDFGATFDAYNYSRNEEEADACALVSDWFSVGDDVAAAVDEAERELKTA